MAPKRAKQPVPEPEDNGQYEVENILKHRKVAGEYEFYVTWKGYGREEDCWVYSDDMNCPETVDAYFRSVDAKKTALRTPAERNAVSQVASSSRVTRSTPAKATPAKAKATPAKVESVARATPAKPIAKATPAKAASAAKTETKASAKRTGSRVNAEKKRKAVDEEVEETPKRRKPVRDGETSRALSSRSGQSSSKITSTIEEQSDDDEAEETSKQVPTGQIDIGKSLLEAYERASQVMAKSPRPTAPTRRLRVVTPVVTVAEEEQEEEEVEMEEKPCPVSPPSAEDPKSRCVIC